MTKAEFLSKLQNLICEYETDNGKQDLVLSVYFEGDDMLHFWDGSCFQKDCYQDCCDEHCDCN